MANGSIMLSVDNAKLAQDDFRVKSEPPSTSHQSCFPPPSCLLSFPFMHEVSGSTAASSLLKWEVFQQQCPLLVAVGTAAECFTHLQLSDDHEWNVSQMQRMNKMVAPEWFFPPHSSLEHQAEQKQNDHQL